MGTTALLMRRTAFVVLAIAVLMGCRGLFAQEQNGQIDVEVTDFTGAVVAHAQIKLRPQPKAAPKNPETSNYGKLSLTVPAGDYELFVATPQLAPWAKKIHVEQGKTENVNVALQNPHDNVIVHTDRKSPIDMHPIHAPEPPRPVPVAIQVTDPTGAAVPYAQVWAASMNTREQREADERGRLELKLIPDEYAVAVTSPSFTRWRQYVQIDTKTRLIRVVLREMHVP